MFQKRPFGRTGHLSTRIIFGVAALGDLIIGLVLSAVVFWGVGVEKWLLRRS
jgi:hypothetical protein